jgi:glutamyl-tRNA synthetase
MRYTATMSPKTVTRFAPSPTGFMHIGGLRTALYAWLLARKENGTFILRIEDTDKEREVPGSIAHIQETLRWLGLEWDYGPDKVNPFGSAIQSERLDTYKVMADLLIKKGYAYPDPYSAEEVDAFRKKAQAEKRPFLFREHRPVNPGVWDGKRPLRFRVPEVKRMKWHDEVRGDLEAGEEGLDDFILIKADGYPTYNFAHIVDDYNMGVTHVMRADEFISSTPKFISLYEALGITQPKLVTLPPILREDKTKKLGKRDGAKDVLEYRAEGYLPDAVMNFLAFIGWNPGTEQELFTREELMSSFSIEGIQTHGAVLNEEKLQWYNREYLMKLPIETYTTLAEPFFSERFRSNQALLRQLIPIARDRAHTFSDIKTQCEAGDFDFFLDTPGDLSAIIIPKKGTAEETKTHLEALYRNLSDVSDIWDVESIKNAVWGYAEEKGRGNVLWPLRVALTGKEKSPDPFTVAAILGKEQTLKRVENAAQM